jgi:ABC-type glycerol-3-phosphate transport system permease component
MDPTAALGVSAQIAVAIAGFAGVVAAFRGDSVHDWGQVEKFWLRLLLLNSILPLVFSVVGLFLLSVTHESPTTWRLCSGFAVLFLVPFAVMILRTVVGFAPGQLEAAGGTRFTSYALFAILMAVCVLQLCNLATLAAFWPFFGALVAQLLGAMYQFVRLVLSPRRAGT